MTDHQGSLRAMSSLLSRRNLLRLTAGAAGAAGLSGLWSTSGASADVVPQAVAPDVLTDDIYPIGFFWPPPRSETTQARYDEIAAAGFNLVLGGNDVLSMPANDAMLKAAAGAGLRALPVEERVSNALPCGNWQDGVSRTLEEYQAYPAFAGFRIADEPSPVTYPRYRMIADVLKDRAPQLLTHFNLVPVYDAGRDAVYREHLSRYIEQVDPTFVSFDHYPLFTDGTVRATYFLNHMRVRNAGLAAGLPTWVYIQAVDHWNLKRPNRAELAWQIIMSLAYGCKGIKYFTYWTPVDRPDFEFGAALIDKQGRQTQVYRDAASLNKDFLQPVGRQLKHKISESVVHANDAPLPVGAIGFSASDQLRAVTGAAVVLGQFKQPGTDDGQRWLLVGNRAYAGPFVTATLTIQPSVGQVSEFNPASGTYSPVTLGTTPNGRTFTSSLPPGGGRLYLLSPQAAQSPAGGGKAA